MKQDKMQAKVKKVIRGYKSKASSSSKSDKEEMHKMPNGKMMKDSDMTKKGY
jgi:hypothetical protein